MTIALLKWFMVLNDRKKKGRGNAPKKGSIEHESEIT
jgi:hypothetical protein